MTPFKSALVVGATGLLGTSIVGQLIAQHFPVRALVRAESESSKIEVLRSQNVELVQGDLEDYESLKSACHGMDAILSTATALTTGRPHDTIEAVDELGHLKLIEAATSCGVRKFVYMSFPEIAWDCPLQRAKRIVEQELSETTLQFTILRSANFSESWLSARGGFDVKGRTARILGTGTKPVSWISIEDVARFAVAAIGIPSFDRKLLHLGGPQAMSPLDVVQTMEHVVGQNVEISYLSLGPLQQMLESSCPIQRSKAAITIATANGLAVDSVMARQLFPLRMRTVREHIESLT